MSDNSTSTGGIGFSGLLTIVFIVLKLTGYIDWSWWWVLSPIWISISLLLLIFAIAVAVAVKRENSLSGRLRRYRDRF